ncbi:hypothetical protein PBRA_002766 [Plasmodiophora brassicae]|uniref:Uncharacterized protein n=1 Tax=Plasmodiophora brassicae TaxID=37360 RepID=A0A0G4J602_PLABS|nr:hypothetical protein PBRA_002766 [Plasmodiophora brassicae]
MLVHVGGPDRELTQHRSVRRLTTNLSRHQIKRAGALRARPETGWLKVVHTRPPQGRGQFGQSAFGVIAAADGSHLDSTSFAKVVQDVPEISAGCQRVQVVDDLAGLLRHEQVGLMVNMTVGGGDARIDVIIAEDVQPQGLTCDQVLEPVAVTPILAIVVDCAGDDDDGMRQGSYHW